MIKHIAPILAVVATGLMSPSIAVAQDAPPSYVADPGVYALILDNEKFRVTRAVWRPGRLDAPHSHPIPSVVFRISAWELVLKSDGCPSAM